MTQNTSVPTQKKWPYILSILIGLMLIFIPQLAGLVSVSSIIVLGWFLTIAALLQVIVLVVNKKKNDISTWILSIGFLFVGIYILINPGMTTIFITWLFAGLLLLSGISNIIHSFSFKGILKIAIIINGVLGIIFAGIIYGMDGVEKITLIGVLLGIHLVLSGTSRLLLR